MARTPRTTNRIFAQNAAAAAGGLAQFGAKKNGTPGFNNNLSQVAALPAYLLGYSAMVTAGELPPLEESNAPLFFMSSQIDEILQDGVPPWDSGTTYYTNSIAQSGGKLYISLVDGNTGNAPASSPTDWQVFASNPTKGENLFRNAGMQVAQRGTSGTITAGTTAYSLDGWMLKATGADLAWQQDVVNGKGFLILTGAGGTMGSLIKQRIESTVSQQLAQNDYVTVQLLLVNGTGAAVTPNLTVNIPTATDNYAAVTTIVNAQPMNTVPGTGATEQVVAYTFNIGANNIQNGLEVIIDFGAALSAGPHLIKVSDADCSKTPTLDVAGIQAGAPLPQIRPIGVEMPFCRRYLKAWGGVQVDELVSIGITPANNSFNVYLTFDVPFRAVPTVSFSAVGDWSVNTPAANVAATSITVSTSGGGLSSLQLNVGVSGTPLTSGQPGTLNASSTTNARLYLSAEL